VRARLTLLSLVATLVIACKHETLSQVHPATEAPVPAPDTLIAEGTLRDPDAFWGRLRAGSGGALAGQPTAAGAIVARAGVDPSLAELVAGSRPFHVALGDGPGGVVFAIAMPLADLGEVRRRVVEGDTARYRGEEVAGMIRLVPREGEPPPVAVAVTWSGYLVIASRPDDLAGLGAYAARTLPTKPAPASSFELRVVPAALVRAGRKAPETADAAEGLLAGTARQLLPPEVDAKALASCFTPGIRDAVAAAGDLAEARVDVDAEDDTLSAVATLVPKPGDNRARKRLTAVHPAVATPLLDAPRDAVAALFWSDTADARADDAATMGPCVGRALAPLFGAGGGPRFADLLAAWTRARGDWVTASFSAKPRVGGLVVRAPVTDAAAASSALRGLVDLASQPGASEAIRRLLPHRAGQAGPLRTVDVPPVGKAQVLMFQPHAPVARGDTDTTNAGDLAPPGVAWAVDAKEADVAVGQTPQTLLAMARPATAMRTSPSIDHAIGALGADASFAAVVVPAGCCAGDDRASAPVTLSWGRRGDDGRITLDVGDVLLGQLLR
jgi:hypothetical protein